MHRAVAKKKILAQEMGQKKNSGRLKIPHPRPHHFSNGPSLIGDQNLRGRGWNPTEIKEMSSLCGPHFLNWATLRRKLIDSNL